MLLTGIELPTESQYRDYQNFTQNQLGLSLGDDKAYLLHGRLQRRMGELGLDNYADYFQMLAADQEGQERQRFFNAITTTKTDFYREKEHFDWLVREIYPELREKISRSELAKQRGGQTLSVLFQVTTPPLVFGWRETRGGGCYKHGPDPPQKNRRLRRRKPHFWTFQNSLFQFVIFQKKTIFVESTHYARLEGGFQRKISENNDKTNVYCLIGAAGEFF